MAFQLPSTGIWTTPGMLYSTGSSRVIIFRSGCLGINQRIKGGGFAGAGRPDNQHHAGWVLDYIVYDALILFGLSPGFPA
jgi:hypothetical protein